MEKIIDALVASLKQEAVYQQYQKALKKLAEDQALLTAYREAKQTYFDMKPYFAYQDFNELKERVMKLSEEVTHLESFQNYMQASQAMQARLEQLNQLIFQDLFKKEGKSDASHCR